VICDEFGYISFDKEASELLFNHLFIRRGKWAAIITTNLAFYRWNEIFNDTILTAGIVDRFTYKAYLINMICEDKFLSVGIHKTLKRKISSLGLIWINKNGITVK